MDIGVVAEAGNPAEIKNKMHFTGKVVKVGLAGAVIDIGMGQPAAIHVSQIISPSGEAVKRVEDVLQVDQEIEVWVRKVKDGRIELTMNKPLELDWRDIKKGMSVKGTVVRLEKFGAFVEIGAERPGLIHISELAHGYVHTPSEVVKEGEEVDVQILDVNRKKKQIKLSIKALEPEPEEAAAEALSSVEETSKTERKERGAGTGARRKKGGRKGSGDNNEDLKAYMAGEEKTEDETDTALGIALREAMEKAQSRKEEEQKEKGRKDKNFSQEQQDILARTLENRVSSTS